MEPARRIELRLRPYQGRVLPLPLGRHELGAQGANLEVSAFKAPRVCLFPYRPSRASPQGRTGLAPLQGADERRSERRGVLGATRTRTAGDLDAVPPAVGLRGRESRHPGSNRAIRRTKAKPQAVRGGEAGHPGLEPGNSGFRARRVCRIPPMAIGYGRSESNAQAARFELARSARLPPLPRAPPGDRTPFRWVRASCITIMLAARRTSPGN
jgi:hypothetical protein